MKSRIESVFSKRPSGPSTSNSWQTRRCWTLLRKRLMNGESQSGEADVSSTWQHSLRAVLLMATLCALILSLWSLGGGASVRMALVTGVLGIPLTLLTNRKAAILGAAVAGAVVATIFGLYFFGIDIERLNDPSPYVKTQYEVKFLVWGQIVGALLGPVLAGVGFWLSRRLTRRGRERYASVEL